VFPVGKGCTLTIQKLIRPKTNLKSIVRVFPKWYFPNVNVVSCGAWPFGEVTEKMVENLWLRNV